MKTSRSFSYHSEISEAMLHYKVPLTVGLPWKLFKSKQAERIKYNMGKTDLRFPVIYYFNAF